MAIDLVALRNELETDPNSYGYAGPYAEGDNGTLCVLLNEVRAGITVDVPTLTAAQMQAAVVGSEFGALADVKQRAWQCVLACGEIPVDNSNIRAQVSSIWGAGTTTRSNLVALQTRTGSRAEELFGAGTVINHHHVAEARNAT